MKLKYWLTVDQFKSRFDLTELQVWQMIRAKTLQFRIDRDELFLQVEPSEAFFGRIEELKAEEPAIHPESLKSSFKVSELSEGGSYGDRLPSPVSLTKVIDQEGLDIIRKSLELTEKSFSTVLAVQKQLIAEKDERIRSMQQQLSDKDAYISLLEERVSEADTRVVIRDRNQAAVEV